jgi:hypothetical protein
MACTALNTTKLNQHNRIPLCGLCAAGGMHYTGALQLEKQTRVYFPTRGVCFWVYFRAGCIFHAVFLLLFAQ